MNGSTATTHSSGTGTEHGFATAAVVGQVRLPARTLLRGRVVRLAVFELLPEMLDAGFNVIFVVVPA